MCFSLLVLLSFLLSRVFLFPSTSPLAFSMSNSISIFHSHFHTCFSLRLCPRLRIHIPVPASVYVPISISLSIFLYVVILSELSSLGRRPRGLLRGEARGHSPLVPIVEGVRDSGEWRGWHLPWPRGVGEGVRLLVPAFSRPPAFPLVLVRLRFADWPRPPPPLLSCLRRWKMTCLSRGNTHLTATASRCPLDAAASRRALPTGVTRSASAASPALVYLRGTLTASWHRGRSSCLRSIYLSTE